MNGAFITKYWIPGVESGLGQDFTVSYYWYDHLVLRSNGEAEIVENAIKNHDHTTFMKFFNKYGEEYFPRIIHNKTYGDLDVTVPEDFDKITHNEFECG